MSQDESIFVYNSDVLREQFAGLMIQRGLSFNHFDDEQTTRVLQNHLQLKYNHVSRTTLKRDAIKLWVAAKQEIIDDFLKLNTNVNLTTDVYSAPHGLPGFYICVTAHWIEPITWQMMKRVIAFEDFQAPHSGSALAKTLRNVFVNFNLKNKIMSITLDNASNNTLAIDKLKLKYEPPMEGRQMKQYFPFYLAWPLILSVQATSVASESAFSTSERVLSIRKTRPTPVSLEMCMCLKDHLNAQERKQDKSTLETSLDFEEEILDDEVQANKAIPLSNKEIAIDAASSEGSMSGPSLGGEEAEADYGCGLHLNVDKIEVFWSKEDPRSRLAVIFPPNIAQPLHGVKLLGGPASVDFEFCNELVMKRVTKTIGLMDAIARINDPQCELLLLRSCARIFRLYFTMRTCPPHVFESSQRSFDVALRSSLERIVTAFGPRFGDWQWRLATLPFAFGGLGVYSAGDTSQKEDHTSDWLRTVHISRLGQTMNACSRVFDGDIYGDHAVSCVRIIGIKHHHNVVRDTLVDICYRSRISAGKEVDIGLDVGCDKPLRPADMLLYSCGEGLDVCVDLTGSSHLTQTGMVNFVPGRSVIDVAHRKRGSVSLVLKEWEPR
nr:hypothetical protein [Tanacetum cinerariifolium]